ncbi:MULTISPECIES: histidine phosphatase family protein [Janibacter]|uniref:SixA phosphatase family protein n=1 Tax=Janibacter TaxID=53457 RepID=UPI0008382B0B|nr:histidine phosphatase family protein [Janibacter terrae]
MTTSAEDRTLILLRHAEPEPGRAGQDDRERPLSEPGRAQAQEVGRWLRERGLGCDEVMCSPALRTRETMQEVAEAGCSEAEVRIEHRLYNADAEDVLSVVRESTDDASVLLVIGHAPGLPAAASLLADGEGRAHAHECLGQGFPPAAAAVLRFSGHWEDLAFGAAQLDDFRLP